MSTVLIAGGSGLIGSRLSELLAEKGYEVTHLSRRKKTTSKYRVYQWDVNQQTIEEEAVQEADYIINLAGAGIVDKRWTARRKQLIIESRTKGNELLRNTLDKLQKKPNAFIASSAIGYYGNTGDRTVDESSDPTGEGFLSTSCMEWERSITPLFETDIRTVLIRIGIVLSTQGGALEKMLISFNFLSGAYFADGKQWYSWIHIDDLCNMFIQAIEQDSMQGIYNGVAPNPARNADLIKAVGKAKKLPFVLLPAPAFALRFVMGEMADTILSSAKISTKVEETGFVFQYPTLNKALPDLLKRKI